MKGIEIEVTFPESTDEETKKWFVEKINSILDEYNSNASQAGL